MGSAPQGRNRGLGEVAHDLRSALSATAAYVDLARERLADGAPVGDEDLARIERALARLSKAIADLDALAAKAPREGSR